ncbi:MAG TPA: Fic/DOC family N-terminal domain-containing protein [Balneolaceae bacterium]|nr:Fic/DOC family N-terminal domain-containing protein [Balneolaceae bacterium]
MSMISTGNEYMSKKYVYFDIFNEKADSMSDYANQPYNILSPLPPKANLETPVILKAAIAANRSLAELKGKAESLPNPSILINSIVAQEAKASSEIENIVTTNDKLFMALSANDRQTDPQTKEVLRYRQALWKGVSSLENGDLGPDLFITLMQTIKESDAGIRDDSGTVIANPKTRKIIYWPPEGEELIRGLLENLAAYIKADNDVDPLIKMAVMHYQFEAIHPFEDGNGRTGRILNILYLIRENLLHQPVLYLSDHIIANKPDYYRLLHEVTEKEAWEPWILFVLEAVQTTSKKTMTRIESIQQLLDETIAEAKSVLPDRVYSKELIELLFEQPYCKVKFLVDRNLAKRQTAADYLKELEIAGFLKSKQVGREVLYLNVRLYNLLSS